MILCLWLPHGFSQGQAPAAHGEGAVAVAAQGRDALPSWPLRAVACLSLGISSSLLVPSSLPTPLSAVLHECLFMSMAWHDFCALWGLYRLVWIEQKGHWEVSFIILTFTRIVLILLSKEMTSEKVIQYLQVLGCLFTLQNGHYSSSGPDGEQGSVEKA